MAILIPSKNIYNKENRKVIDNAISKIEIVQHTNAFETKEKDILKSESSDNFVNRIESEINGNKFSGGIWAYEDQKARAYNFTIRIKSEENKVIHSLYHDEKIENGLKQSEIKWQVYGTKTTKSASAWFRVEDGQYYIDDIEYSNIKVENDVLFEVPELPSVTNYSTTFFKDNYNKFSVNVNEIQKGKEFEISISNILAEYTSLILFATESDANNTNYFKAQTHENYPYTTFIPKRIDFTIYGKTTTLNLVEDTYQLGFGTGKNVVSIKTNELIKDANIYSQNGNIEVLTGVLFDEFYQNYKNGKETATIRCSISDYYDNNGEKVISVDNSTGKMTFEIGDEVIPMVYLGQNKGDKQMSRGKIFQVAGVKPYYDGAVWQELSLIEERIENVMEDEIPVGTEGLAYSLLEDGTYRCDGIGTATDTDIVIPEFVNGTPVTALKSQAFNRNKTITSVKIPANVVDLGNNNTFSSCDSLLNVTFAEGSKLEKICYGAFSSCAVESINIPQSVKIISSEAFRNCKNLKSVTIPVSVTSIGDESFYQCSKLNEMVFCGTMAQWNNITFGANWKSLSYALKTVNCIDGEITL